MATSTRTHTTTPEAACVCLVFLNRFFSLFNVPSEQQITLYPHGDENNDWRILNGTEQGNPLDDWESLNPLRFITNGQRLKFRHLTTEKNLHSHDFRPPVSEVEFQNEVSAYGMPGFIGDSNDDWIIELDGGAKTLKTLRTKFRLRHVLTGCYLFSHKVKLPQWGYEQQEVTCNKNAVKANSLWMIETSDHPYSELVPFTV